MGLKRRRRWAGEGVRGRMDRRFLREGADFCSAVAPRLHSSYPSATWTSEGLKQQYREFGGSESNHRMFVQLFQSAEKKCSLKPGFSKAPHSDRGEVRGHVWCDGASHSGGSPGGSWSVCSWKNGGVICALLLHFSPPLSLLSHRHRPADEPHLQLGTHGLGFCLFFKSTTGSIAQLSEGLPSRV